jgi:hypothetical protein
MIVQPFMLASTTPHEMKRRSIYNISWVQVMIPLNKVAAVEPVTMKQTPPEKYVHTVTVDSHDFWFMGFVSYDKAVHNLAEAVSHRGEAATMPESK